MSDHFGAVADRPGPGETGLEPGALAGMRVLECCETTAGAYCGKLLSDLGAEVVSVNRGATPVPGDDPRNAEPAGRRLYLSTGKRRVEIDWETQEGARRCPWDPVCEEHEGACASCLHLAFGCPERNTGLDRATLFGSPAEHDLPVDKGFWEGL